MIDNMDEALRRVAFRVEEKFLHRPGFDDLAIFNYRHVVAHMLEYVQLVGNEHDRQLELAVDLAQKLQDGISRLRIESGCRFVAEQQIRLVDERAGDADALLLPAAQLKRIDVLLVAKLHQVENFSDPGADERLRMPRHLQRKSDILKNGARVKQVELLKNHADFLPRLPQLLLRQIGNHFSPDLDGARIRLFQPIQATDQGRFARPGKADDSEDVALGDEQIDVLQNGNDAFGGFV